VAKIYYLSCKDVGVECDFEARGESLDDVIEACAQHSMNEHGMRGFGNELYARIRSHMRVFEEPEASKQS
jgi:predicted small metal-binding protein